MRGPDILELQLRLQELGYYPEKANGIYTEAAQRAIKNFQKSKGIKVDGVVGPITWMALDMNSSSYFSFQQVYDAPSIIIDIDRRVLVFASNSLVKIYPAAVGRPSLPTPLGNWNIVSKALNPGGPFGVRWMRLSVPWGGYGIHGTNNPKSIGKSVSHGCIRLYNSDVIEVYDRTPVGTPVTVIGKAYNNRDVKLNDNGSDVQEIQKMLKKMKYYRARLDGEFGLYTEQAVKDFQTRQSLKADGIVGSSTLTALQRAYAEQLK
jgi:peptidoglycan hydrolase-like protein with peptidoglycan-binding domain